MRPLLWVCVISLALGCSAVHLLDIDPAWNDPRHHTDAFRPHLRAAATTIVLRRGRAFSWTLRRNGDAAAVDGNAAAASVRLQNVNIHCVATEGTAGEVYYLGCALPGNAPVGRHTVVVTSNGVNVAAAITAIVLFNPYEASDRDVYLGGVNADIDEYINEAVGHFRWAHDVNVDLYWSSHNLNQFQILEPLLDFMEEARAGTQARAQMTTANAHTASAARVASWWAFVLQHDQHSPNLHRGLLQGYWGRPHDPALLAYNADIDPTTVPRTAYDVLQWTSMADIFALYRANQVATGTTARYGQCFVFGNLMTAIMRSLGIPSRTVSVLGACKPEVDSQDPTAFVRQGYHVIDGFNAHGPAIWNYHVWSEQKFFDATPNAVDWHAADPSFRIEPALLSSIAQNVLGNQHVNDMVDTMKAAKFQPLGGPTPYNSVSHDVTSLGNAGLFNKDYCAQTRAWIKIAGVSTDVTTSYKPVGKQDPWNHHFLLETNSQLKAHGRQRPLNPFVHRSRFPGKEEKPQFQSSVSKAPLWIDVVPTKQAHAGDKLKFELKRGDTEFGIDKPMQVRVAVVSTLYNRKPVAVVHEKTMDIDLKKGSAIAVSLELTVDQYLKFIPQSIYFMVEMTFFEKGKTPPPAIKDVTKKDDKADKSLAFSIAEHFTLEQPPLAVLPHKKSAIPSDYLAMSVALHKQSPEEKANIWKQFDGGVQLDKDGTPNIDREFTATAVFGNTVGVDLTDCFVTVSLPGESAKTEKNVKIAKGVEWKLDIAKVVADPKSPKGSSQLVTVDLTCKEIGQVRGQFVFRAGKHKPPAEPKDKNEAALRDKAEKAALAAVSKQKKL